MPTFEKQSDGTLVPIVLEGEYAGQGVIRPLVMADGDGPSAPETLSAPGLEGSMPAVTSVELVWTPAADGTSKPPVTAWEIQRRRSYDNGASYDAWAAVTGSPVAATARTFTDGGLASATPQIIREYRVRGVNAAGDGDWSNAKRLQWQSVDTGAPTAPTNLTLGTIASTSVPLSWTETADAMVTKHGIFEGNTLVRDNLDRVATSYVYAGLVAQSTHTNVNVRRANLDPVTGATRWSPASNMRTFTTTGNPGIQHDVVMGTSVSGPLTGYNPYRNWGAIRSYSRSAAAGYVTTYGARVLAVTDDPNLHYESGASGAQSLENWLEDFYYGNGSANRKSVEVHWGNGNEIDRDFINGAPISQAFIDSCRLQRAAIWRTNPDGTRRYPNASMWLDMTNFQIHNRNSGASFKPAARYLDGVACSMYPPRRFAEPVVWTEYPQSEIDSVLNVVQDWMLTGSATGGRSNITQFATWEIGVPIDHAFTNNATGPPSGDPTAQTNFTIRPRWMTGGVDSTGKNWKGFLQYVYDGCTSRGIIMREQLWWNQQSDTRAPNQFTHDRSDLGRANPDTVTAWHDWVPGKRLPNG